MITVKRKIFETLYTVYKVISLNTENKMSGKEGIHKWSFII